MLAYFLKVNVAIVLFYAFYRLFFYKDTFFGWRRTAMLCFFAISAAVPLLNIQTWITAQEPMVAMADLYASVVLPEFTITPEAATTDWKSLILEYAGIAYWIIVVLLAMRFAIQLAGIIRLACRCHKIQIGDSTIHLLPRADGPFSFFRWIFIHPASHTEEEFNEILTHEQTHARQWHSIDVIISELTCTLCWFNPFAWLMKREIRTNLEYMADARVLEDGYDSKTYQYHLLGLSHHKAAATIYNSFNVLPLKKRIKMMNKKRTKEIGRTKYLMFLPLAALLMIISNIETVARTSEIWMPALTAIEDLPLSVINPDQKGETTFHVTIVDKQGKVVPNVKIQTTLAGKQLNFKTGADGKADITLDMNGLKHATMYAATPDGNNFIFVLSSGETVRTINIDEHQYAPITYTPDANGIFEVVEHMPEFANGGMSGLMKYLSENIRYPAIAHENGTQGRVTVQFVVEKDGAISNAKILRGADPDLDKEAIRVVNAMPKWKPGTQDGQAVRVKYTIPVMFRLTGGEEPVQHAVATRTETGEIIFEVVEVMPEFPGGMSALMDFISKNIKYPVEAQKAGTQGRVTIQFIVNTEGDIVNPKVLRGVDPLLDAEALRLTTIMPKWKPGTQKGQAVNVKYTIPVMFRLG
ncbi:TonB family protein [Bacteroides sp.]|uniref:TonB family protein n=1 Tax=Bacteroides sp. TaxID=29523 RepID=UPI003AB5FF58